MLAHHELQLQRGVLTLYASYSESSTLATLAMPFSVVPIPDRLLTELSRGALAISIGVVLSVCRGIPRKSCRSRVSLVHPVNISEGSPSVRLGSQELQLCQRRSETTLRMCVGF